MIEILLPDGRRLLVDHDRRLVIVYLTTAPEDIGELMTWTKFRSLPIVEAE